jgi:hypothetical protein
LDLDYSSPVPYEIKAGEDLKEVLNEFSEGITSFFHWILEPSLYHWLEPVARETVAGR